jgi:hypothetical protein
MAFGRCAGSAAADPAYWCFQLLGAGTLFPWNVLITAADWWEARFPVRAGPCVAPLCFDARFIMSSNATCHYKACGRQTAPTSAPLYVPLFLPALPGKRGSVAGKPLALIPTTSCTLPPHPPSSPIQGKHTDRLLTVCYLPVNLVVIAAMVHWNGRVRPRLRVIAGLLGFTFALLAVTLVRCGMRCLRCVLPACYLRCLAALLPLRCPITRQGLCRAARFPPAPLLSCHCTGLQRRVPRAAASSSLPSCPPPCPAAAAQRGAALFCRPRRRAASGGALRRVRRAGAGGAVWRGRAAAAAVHAGARGRYRCVG